MALYPALFGFSVIDVPDADARRLPTGGTVRIDRRPIRRRGSRV